MKTQVVFFGSGSFGLPALAALVRDHRFKVGMVVSQPPRIAGDRPQDTPVTTWAKETHLPIQNYDSLKSPGVAEKLREFSADVWVVIDYGLILPAASLIIPPRGVINAHASLLPRHRGAAPIAAAIMHGDTKTGITVMQMDSGIDTGPILVQRELLIQADETAPHLSERLAQLAADVLPDALKSWVSNKLAAQPQSDHRANYVKRLTRDDGRANWNSGQQIARNIRALQPWPGVWFEWRHQRVKLLAGVFIPGRPHEPPGTVIIRPAQQLAICCQDGWIEPRILQWAGKQPQPAERIPGSYPRLIGSRLA